MIFEMPKYAHKHVLYTDKHLRQNEWPHTLALWIGV